MALDCLKSLGDAVEAMDIAEQHAKQAVILRNQRILDCVKMGCEYTVIGEVIGLSRNRAKQLAEAAELYNLRLISQFKADYDAARVREQFQTPED